MKITFLKNPRKGKIVTVLVVAGALCFNAAAFSQDGASEETDDILIYDDEIRVDADVSMTIYGNLTTEVGSTIQNNGEVNFAANDDYREIYNNSSDTVFNGTGLYAFTGNYQHYLSGDYNLRFPNLELNKKIASAVVCEIPELQITNKLTLTQGVLDAQSNVVRIENPDSGAISTEFLNIFSFIDGRLIRRVQNANTYHFPISSSRIIHPVVLSDRFEDVNYIEVSFSEGADVDLSAQLHKQYGIALFNHLDNTGSWNISPDKKNPKGDMDLEAAIYNFREYPSYEDNMFGLLHTDEINPSAQDWQIEGELEYFNSPYRKTGTLTTRLKGSQKFGYYAVGVAERQRFVNLIAPGGGRESRFIIQGLNIENPDESQYDNENCELVVYNIYGAEVWRKKPYENDLDLKDFMDGTYYYEFRFTIDGRQGFVQSYIDVKRMD